MQMFPMELHRTLTKFKMSLCALALLLWQVSAAEVRINARAFLKVLLTDMFSVAVCSQASNR